MRIVETHPAAGESVQSTQVSIDLCVDRRLDPNSIDVDDLRLRSGVVFYDAQVELELENWREPGTDEWAESPWCAGSVLRLRPSSPLAAGVAYRLIMYDAQRGWEGERFDPEDAGWIVPDAPDTEGSDDPRFEETRFVLEFAVAPEAVDPEIPPVNPPPEAPTLTELFEEGEIFDPGGGCSCHADPEDPATELLDLRDPTRAYESLVLDPRRGPTGTRRVTPGRPEQSYLLHKCLREGDATLHAVPGAPMPPGRPLSAHELSSLSAWIYAGAPL